MRLFRQRGDVHGEAFSLCLVSRVHLFEQDPAAAIDVAGEALRLAASNGDGLVASVAHLFLGAAHLLMGNFEQGRRHLQMEIEFSVELDSAEGTAYGLEGLTVGAAMEGDAAGRLLSRDDAVARAVSRGDRSDGARQR